VDSIVSHLGSIRGFVHHRDTWPSSSLRTSFAFVQRVSQFPWRRCLPVFISQILPQAVPVPSHYTPPLRLIVPAARDHFPLIPPFLSLNPCVRTRHGPPNRAPFPTTATGHLHRLMRQAGINLEIYSPANVHLHCSLHSYSFLCGEFISIVESWDDLPIGGHWFKAASLRRGQHQKRFMIGVFSNLIWCAHRLFTFGLLSRSSR
jgi:hypothetical protein